MLTFILAISTALMMPRRPKQYCLQLVIHIYIYFFFFNLLFLYDFLYFFLQHLCRSLKIWKVVKFHFHIVLKIVYMTWKIK